MTLEGRDIFEFRNVDGCLIVEGHVGAQEVVMSYDESCEGNGAVVGFKAAAWTDVEFESSIESLDELFEWSEGC